MKWLACLTLIPALALASEQCVTQLGGTCRSACSAGEKPEQGAFIDCSEHDKCCVPTAPRKDPGTSSPVILIEEMAFVPEVIEVKAGTEVTWRNKDSSLHTVTAVDGSFSSSPLNEGAVFKRAFAKPGTYAFTCEMHPFMSGKIVVK